MKSKETDIGICPSHWEVVKFSSVAELKHGYQFRTNDFTDSGIKVFKITQIKSDGTIDLTSCSFIDESRLESFQHNIINNGDILMALSGATIGKIGRFNSDEIVLQNYRVGNFIPHEDGKILKDYFYYFLTTENTYFQIMANQNQSAQENVGKADIHNMLVFLPPYNEQVLIAEVLSSLDDKIDLLHRQNQTLEQLAETLFRQWFPPGGGHGAEEADEGWKEGVLGDEFEFTMGQSPPGSSFNEKGVGTPMYQGNRDFGFRFPQNRVFTTEPKRFAQKFDTLLSVRAPVGEQNMANEKCCIGRGVAAFRYKANPMYYTYTFFKMKSLMDEIKQFNETGTVFGSISKNDFQEMQISIPSVDMVESFQNEVKPIDDRIISNCTQIRTLTVLRDTLLPKLMSGEVRVVV